jgi:EmrB/QacA subfamily drug resistance transporter
VSTLASPGLTVQADPRRWKALAVLALVQFMLILDITVVNVSLPFIKRDLGFSQSGLAWVVDGYTLMAGGLLLLGGRLSDLIGRRRLFLIGVAVFAVASLTCGAAQDPTMLVVSRFVQGTGEAMAAPAALGLVALLFPDPIERTKALGIWGGLAGLGGTLGTVISGVLTDYASWRWIFFVNLPVAAFALLVVPRLVNESKAVRTATQGRPDVAGAVAVTGGAILLVYGLLRAPEVPSWGSPSVVVPIVLGLLLLVAFVVIERSIGEPLVPKRFFENRTRVTANVATLFFASAFFTYFFLLTLFMQQVLRYSPAKGGVAYLPFGITIGVAIGIGTALMPKLGVKPLLAGGFIVSAVGMYLTSGIDPHADYAPDILPGMMVLAFGAGVSFAAMGNAALHGVTGQDASLASGVQNAVQQLGGALGLAVLASIALRYAANHHGPDIAAIATHGFVLAFRVGTVMLLVGAAIIIAFMEQYKAAAVNPEVEAAAALAAETEGAPA